MGLGQQAQAQLGRRGAQRGVWGPGNGSWEEGSRRQRTPWCRCALRATRRSPLNPEAQTHLRRKERKKPPLARISGSQSNFCPKHRPRTRLGAAQASPLSIFGLFLEEPVPQARVAGVGTLVNPAAGPCRRPPSPGALSCHLRPWRRASVLPRPPGRL